MKLNTLMHAAWAMNKRKPWYNRKVAVCNVVPIKKSWWEDSHDWSAAVDGKMVFRKDRGRRGGRMALYFSEALDSVEIEVDDKFECLWVRIRGKVNRANILVGIFYTSLKQDEEVDELF